MEDWNHDGEVDYHDSLIYYDYINKSIENDNAYSDYSDDSNDGVGYGRRSSRKKLDMDEIYEIKRQSEELLCNWRKWFIIRTLISGLIAFIWLQTFEDDWLILCGIYATVEMYFIIRYEIQNGKLDIKLKNLYKRK